MVDTADQGLLLLGDHLSRKPDDKLHPFGYGMEQYFWSFIVAILIFGLGGAVSIYQGAMHVASPEPLRWPIANAAVIAVAALFEGASFAFSFRQYRSRTDRRLSLGALSGSKDPKLFTVLLEDSAALAGLAIAGAGIAASVWLGWLEADGYASIAIGVLLAAIAVFLARETRSLLIGEAASPAVVAAIEAAANEHPAVKEVREVFTLHLGPERILVALSLQLESFADVQELRDAISAISKNVRRADERIAQVFFRPAGAAASIRKPGMRNRSNPAGTGS
jgi:cation diffusion facilitator family transporter